MGCFTPEQFNKCTLALEGFTWIETANMLRQIASSPRLVPYPNAPIVRQLQNLNLIVSRDANQSKVAFEVLQVIEANDFCFELVQSMHQWHPFDQNINDLLEGFKKLPVAEPDRGVEVERLLRITRDQFLNPVLWAERFGPIRYRVCRVELGNPKAAVAGQGFGTAFLVGPDLVLTNHHVIEPVLSGKYSANQIILGFDRVEGSDSAIAGPHCGLKRPAKQSAWLVAMSESLDYALLKLSKAMGDEPIVATSGGGSEGQAAKRGWFELSVSGADEIKLDDSQLIIQHPDGLPLKMDMGIVTKLTDTRIRYNTSTMPGSSGSPCFDRELRVVALHHAGASTFNQGIPMSAILDDLEEKGKDSLVKTD